MQQAEQKPRWSTTASVGGAGIHLQQDLTMMRQQLQDEEAKLQQLAQSMLSVKQKAALVSSPAEAASMQARYGPVHTTGTSQYARVGHTLVQKPWTACMFVAQFLTHRQASILLGCWRSDLIYTLVHAQA